MKDTTMRENGRFRKTVAYVSSSLTFIFTFWLTFKLLHHDKLIAFINTLTAFVNTAFKTFIYFLKVEGLNVLASFYLALTFALCVYYMVIPGKKQEKDPTSSSDKSVIKSEKVCE